MNQHLRKPTGVCITGLFIWSITKVQSEEFKAFVLKYQWVIFFEGLGAGFSDKFLIKFKISIYNGIESHSKYF